MRSNRVPFSLLMAGLVAAACASPPEEQVQAARAKLDSARAEGAPDYAAESFKGAQDVMARLDAELKAQSGKFALFRSYGEAKKLADSARAAAEKALADARVGKEKARTEAQGLIGEARQAIDQARKLLAVAPAGKGSAVDLAALRADLQSAETAANDAQSAFDAGRYAEAKAKAQTALDGASKVKSAVEEARRRVRPRRA